MSDSERPTALVLRALYLGDFLTGLPALALLRRALPGHRVVLAAPEQFRPLLPLVTANSVDDLVPALELAPLTDAPRGADVAVDLHGNGPESRDLLAATGPRRIVAFADGVTEWRADEHEVSRWCRLVATAFDQPEHGWPGVAGALAIPDAARHRVPRGVTVLHPGAKSAARRWPVERFAALARALQAAGHNTVATAGPGEEELAAQIGVPVLSGLSLLELLALVAQARLVVCGDTGIAHIASNYGTPSVVLFGPVSPANWGPPPDPRHRVLWRGDGTGDPHGTEPHPALLDITADEVLAAVGTSLA